MHVSVKYFVRAYWKDYALGLACLLGTNLLSASIPLQIKHIIDALGVGGTGQAIQTAWLIAGVIVAMFFIRVMSRYFLIGVGRKIEFETRMALFDHLMRLPRSFYDVQQTGDLMSRLTNDLTALRIMLGGGTMLIANVLFAYLTVLPLMGMLSWRLTLLAFLLYPPIVGLMRIISGRVKRLSHEVQDTLGDLTAVAQENFSGMSVIQSYAKESVESERFHDSCLAYLQANTRLVKARSMLYILIAGVSGLSLLVVLGEGGREVIAQELSLSGITAFMLYLERLSWPTVSMGWILSSLQQGIAAKERIKSLFAYEPAVTDAQADASLTQVPVGAVLTVRDLTFSYENPYSPTPEDTAPPPPVLQSVSFSVAPGEIVALVGPIGSGKTTLLQLLMRLYNPPPNTIFLGEVALERYPLSVLRRAVTLMPQNSFLFSTAIGENIAYGLADCPDTQAHVEAMASVVTLHPEVMALPQQYGTLVGERGVTLSGGQRQRSTLARTLLVAPQILLLDDPFSNVDAETENTIIESLHERRLLKDRITLFASQRFTLVRQATRIIVLDEAGHVDAIGTHEELIDTSSVYRQLLKLDAAAREEASSESEVLRP